VLDFVFEQLSARVQRVRETAAAARLSPDAESVHQLRVSIRRLTEAVRSLHGWVKPKASGKLRERVRPVMKAAGETRNLDVARELCLDAALPSSAAAAEALSVMRTGAAHKLIDELLSLNHAKLRPPCEPNVNVPAPRDLGAGILADLVPRYWEAGDKAARPQASWTDLHQFRLATKHLRYTIELFEPAYGPGAKLKLEVLKHVQTHLGKVNDCDTARALEPIKADSTLEAWIIERQTHQREKFLETWEEERTRSRAGANWLRYFTRLK
jgi:CHAD domain-containing protein